MWLGKGGCSDKVLSELFVKVLVDGQMSTLNFQFSDEGLTFVGANRDVATSAVAMLEAVAQQVRESPRYTNLKSDKTKERLIARLASAFWLPLLMAVAELGQHKKGTTYALTCNRLRAYQLSVNKPTSPQTVMMKHFHTPRKSKWSDAAAAPTAAMPMVCLCVGKRAEGKALEPRVLSAREQGLLAWKDKYMELSERHEELDLMIDDLVDDNRAAYRRIAKLNEKVRKLEAQLEAK